MNLWDFFLGSIPLVLDLYSDMYRETDYKSTMLELESDFNVPTIKTYDFIVVGGGSAGCVVAARLSEYHKVLLLEAGGTPPPAVAVPYLRDRVYQPPSINNIFESVPQTNASWSTDGILTSSTGKMLGGSGSHNGMLHSRGSPKDYDNWAELLNDDSFRYMNVLKYFRKMETYVGQKIGTEGDEYYGLNGPIVVNSSDIPSIAIWLNAGRELGYSTGDPNGFQREGFTTTNTANRDGKRSSSYAEYIKPIEATRATLTVIRYAEVSEILFDDNQKAYGVAYSRHGFPQIAHAEKEVILSAGTFSSPLLLMKSGIGPENILNDAGISIRVPSEAVGKNLQEHPSFRLGGSSTTDLSHFSNLNTSEAEKIFEQFHNGYGPLSFSLGGAQCFIRSSNAEPEWPNLFIPFVARLNADGDEQQITFVNVLGRPKSRGTLTLDANKYRAGIRDDVELALIDFKHLTHPDDLNSMLEAVKFSIRMTETEVMKNINLTFAPTPDPSCSSFTFLSDDYWRCKIQQDTLNYNHLSGTCSLGSDTGDSSTSVVDTKFRVRGVSNLRVVDASVIPVIPNANINAAVLMLAEKASEDILNVYNVTDTNESDDTTTSTTSTQPPERNGARSELVSKNNLLTNLSLSLTLLFIMNYFEKGYQ